MSSVTSAALFTGKANPHPESDYSSDVEMLRDMTMKLAREQSAMTKTMEKNVKKLEELEKELAARKEENEQIKEENRQIERHCRKISSDYDRIRQNLTDLGFIESKLEEAENKGGLSVELKKFHEKMKKRIQNSQWETDRDQELALDKLNKMIAAARSRRSDKIYWRSGICGIIGGLAVGSGAAALYATGFAVLGAIGIGGLIIGLVAWGGQTLYVQWHDQPPKYRAE